MNIITTRTLGKEYVYGDYQVVKYTADCIVIRYKDSNWYRLYYADGVFTCSGFAIESYVCDFLSTFVGDGIMLKHHTVVELSSGKEWSVMAYCAQDAIYHVMLDLQGCLVHDYKEVYGKQTFNLVNLQDDRITYSVIKDN